MKYLAVFKSLSYANRLQNYFDFGKTPTIIKTPKKVAGGCSYSVVFNDDKINDVKKYLQKNSRGFIGIYREMLSGKYDEMEL